MNQTKDSLQLAKEGAHSIGGFPHLFTSAIRAVVNQRGFAAADRLAAGERLPSAAEFLVKRSPTIRALLYFLAEESRPADLAKIEKLSLESLMTLFTPGELVAVIGLSLLKSRLKKKCDKDEWRHWTEQMSLHMRISAAVGDTFRRVGYGGGLLAGGMRYLGCAVFLMHDAKGFQELRRKWKTANKLFDLDAEKAKWGCNHLEICSCLVQTLGYGLGVGMGFGMSKLQRDPSVSEDEFRTLEEDTISWQATITWAESLHATGKAPKGLSKDDAFYLPEDVTAEMAAQVQTLIDAHSGRGWIQREISSLTSEVAQALKVNPAEIKEGGVEGEVAEEEDA